MYEERFHLERPGPYSRGVGERRPPFGRPDDDYGRGRGCDYDSPRFHPNGGPRNFHGEEQRNYHDDGHHSFNNEPRGGPPNRRQDDYSYYRGPRDDNYSGRQSDFRGSSRVGPPPSSRGHGSYSAPRSLMAIGSEQGDDSVQSLLNLGRGEDREVVRRKGLFPPARDHSPSRREVPPSPHSRSGSSISSRSFSPERSKSHTYQPTQGKRFEESYGPSRSAERERAPGPSLSVSRDGSPHSFVSASKEEVPVIESLSDEPVAPADETSAVMDNFQERRSQAIAAKAREIEKVYRQDCETFGMVVKMLVAKDPSLEKHLQNPLKENLSEIRERCLEDLRHFISELDEVVRQPEATA